MRLQSIKGLRTKRLGKQRMLRGLRLRFRRLENLRKLRLRLKSKNGWKKNNKRKPRSTEPEFMRKR